jgi:two-component system OmpR family response regulator
MSGLDLLRQLTTPLTCPVILMSGNDTAAARTEAVAAGAIDYIVKPFAPSELASRVRAALPA